MKTSVVLRNSQIRFASVVLAGSFSLAQSMTASYFLCSSGSKVADKVKGPHRTLRQLKKLFISYYLIACNLARL